jgi:AmmeMemoRadiSam system protein B
MATPLPRLRMNLDFMPSPLEERPGLLIRDSFQYSDATLIIPPVLVPCLEMFDGSRTDLDLKEVLVRITGQLDVSTLQDHLTSTLSTAGFLHDHVYDEMRESRHKEFEAAESREPSHAGAAYPDEVDELREVMEAYMEKAAPTAGKLIGIAAPHVSPFGGWESYCAAYGALGQDYKDKTFVVLGTSHYGEPDRFGLTRKDFVTPFGTARTDRTLVDELVGERAAKLEDYCHAVEHSIEFQVLFLQHLFGPDIKILPVLCGSYARTFTRGGLPEDRDDVRSFLDRLGEIGAREGGRLFWVLGIDMAHIGARYQDPFVARANEGVMLEIGARDKDRIARAAAGDPRGFWELVQENGDDLKWCGSSPMYTFLKAVPQARGELRRYEQWNIDDRSVVSFGAMAFTG